MSSDLGTISVWSSQISGAHSIATGGLAAAVDHGTEAEDSRVSSRGRPTVREIPRVVAVAQVRGNMVLN